MTDLGTVVALYRHPVKALAGSRHDTLDVDATGVVGDRRWALVDPAREDRRFPWWTLREQPDLVRHVPRPPAAGSADADDEPPGSEVEIETPDGDVVTLAALAAGLGPDGAGVRVLRAPDGAPDQAPVSLLSVQSVDSVSAVVGRPLDARRFRPNLLLDLPGLGERREQALLGRRVRVGEVLLRVDDPDPRCAVPDVDPDTGEVDRAVLRAVAREHDNVLGVYAAVLEPGTVRTGDRVVDEGFV